MNIEQLIEQVFQYLVILTLEFVTTIKSAISTGIALAILIIWRFPTVVRMIDKLSLRLFFFTRKDLSYTVNLLYKHKDNIKALLSECYGYALGQGYFITHVALYYTHNGNKDVYGKYADKMSMLSEHGYNNTFMVSNQNVSLIDVSSYLEATLDNGGVLDLCLEKAPEQLKVQLIKHGWKQVSVVTYNDSYGKPLLIMLCYFRQNKPLIYNEIENIKCIEENLFSFLKQKLILINGLLSNNELHIPTFKYIV
jgi:hypothetical protein